MESILRKSVLNMKLRKIITNKWEISNLRNQQTTQMKWLKIYRILVAGCEAHVGTWVKMSSVWITLCKCKRLCIYFDRCKIWVQSNICENIESTKLHSYFLLSHNNDSKGSWLKKHYYLLRLFFFWDVSKTLTMCSSRKNGYITQI